MHAGITDIIDGMMRWRVWHLLGVSLLRQRYARSSLGQYWIVIGTAITTAAFGLLWSQLWGQPIKEFVPYVAIAHIGWTVVTAPLLDGIGTIQANSYYFVNQKAPLSTVFFANFYRNMIILAHNLLVVIVIWLLFSINPGWQALLVIPGLILNGIVAINLGILIGLICTRYRDMQQVVGNALQVMYFMTPVMWMPEFLPEKAKWIGDFNPLGQLLAIIRDPLLGRPIDSMSWIVATVTAVTLAILAPMFLSRFGKRVVFWI